jgi:amino acid transporter
VTTATSPNLEVDGLRRDVGPIGLLFSSTTSVIGSGWLFAAFTAAAIAGPSSIFSWLIGGAILALIALCYSELSTLLPVAGGSSRYPHYAFGSLAGGIFGWFSYLQAASVAPIEAIAAISYLSATSWGQALYDRHTNQLSTTGIVVAIAVLLAFVVINLVGVAWVARTNSTLTWWKISVPVLVVLVLLGLSAHPGNLTSFGFFAHGSDGGLHAVLAAVSEGGVIFGLLGFEQAVQLGGESANPSRDLPLAVLGSLGIGVVLYTLIQLVFLISVSPESLAHLGGWTHLGGDTALGRSPFLTISGILGLSWLAWIVRVDAVLSPAGAALIYQTTSSRLLYGLARNGYVPRRLEQRTSRAKVPWLAVAATTTIGILFLFPFPSWSKLVSVCTTATIMMYASTPLSLAALRRSLPEPLRPFRLPAARFMAPLAFACANLIVYWAGWGVYSTLMLTLVLWLGVWGVTLVMGLGERQPNADLGAAVWLVPYLVGMGVIAYLGNFGHGPMADGLGPFAGVAVGATGWLPADVDLIVVALFSVAIYALAMTRRLPEAMVRRYVADLYPPATLEEEDA